MAACGGGCFLIWLTYLVPLAIDDYHLINNTIPASEPSSDSAGNSSDMGELPSPQPQLSTPQNLTTFI